MTLQMPTSGTRQSLISVAVRVRPFTTDEENKLIRETEQPVFYGDGGFLQNRRENDEQKRNKNTPLGLRKIVNVVDNKMLIFDPPELNPLNSMQRQVFPNAPFRGRIRDYRFVFDHLFDETSTQEEVYQNTTKPLLDSVLDGFNATVFAYGATGCGKTYTISGSPENPGVIFLTMQELYKKIGLLSDTRLVDVSVSFLEIYNETIRDLLAPQTPSKNLSLREDLAKRIVVSNLSTHKPNTVDDVMHLLMVGNHNRTCSPTEANAALSRSHAVLQINVTLHDRTASLSEEHTYATLSIIDLAGSERAAATKNRGARLNEGANINKSLLALGNCINALCDPRRHNHIPYRDLKLTRLLKFSLGGNCKTVMIVCILPLSQHYDETLNTLKYADRAKEIKTKVMRNRQNLDRHVGSYLKMITEQKLEIEELRAREHSILRANREKVDANNAACLQAIVDSIASLRATVDKPHHDKWRKYFLLAKRKFLLLHVRDLEHVVGHVHKTVDKSSVCHPVRRFLVQAEQLQHKFKEQIINLERFYDSRLETDDILAESVAHTLKRFEEMDGWTLGHTHVYQKLAATLHEHLQKDMLVNSSILFDFLVGHMHEFAFLSHALCDTIDSCQMYRQGSECTQANEIDATLDRATSVLEKMNDSDYDMALEEATSLFINGRKDHSASRTPDSTIPASPSATSLPEALIGRMGQILSLGQIASLAKSIDKRLSTSPLRNLRAPKRAMKTLSLAEESDMSMDDSAFLTKNLLPDDDSPISNHVNLLMLDFDHLHDQSNILDSPTMKAETPERGRSVAYTERRLLMPSPEKRNPLRLPLLNKQASTKIANTVLDLDPPHKMDEDTSVMDLS